ncbi:MAG: TonB-dependent siderophore receptor [Pseudomonadota bacterium]
MRFRNRFAAALLASTLLATPALAQSSAEPEETERELETVIVTGQESYYDDEAVSATRLDIPIIETPQSVFVINSDLIADQQAFRFDQVLQNDASVQKSNNFLGAYSSYSIRGFQLSNGSNYFRDGRTFFHLASVPVETLDRVEVLKGPSSVLYGTMSPGGIINMITKRPADDPFTSIKATVGSDAFNHFALDHSGVLIEDGAIGDLAYRVNAVFEESDSFREFADGRAFETERLIGSVVVEWNPTDQTSILFNYDYTDDDRPQDIGLVNTTGDFTGQSYERIVNQPWTLYDSTVTNYYFAIDHELTEIFSLRAGTSIQDYKRDRYDNQYRGNTFDPVTGDIDIRARRRINRWNYTTYFADLIAEFETGPFEHQVLIGIDQTDVEIDNNETARNEIISTNIFDPVIVPDPLINVSPIANTGSEDRSGVTFQNLISYGEQWRLLIGGRYDEFQSEFFVGTSDVSLPRPDIDNFTPRIGLLYLPNPNLSVYVSYSESFEPNGPVTNASLDNFGQQLDPTVGESIEAGVKWEAFDGRLLTTAAAFTIERSGVPFEDVGLNRIVQRGTQEHNGFEASVTGLLNDNLTLTGSATFLDAEFTVDDNPAIVGNTPFGVPDFSGALTGEYEFFAGPLSGFAIQGSIFYESDRPIDDANTYDLDGYTRVDIGGKYTQQLASGNDLIFRVSALNLFDEEYYKARTIFGVNPEQPLQIRGSIEVRF